MLSPQPPSSFLFFLYFSLSLVLYQVFPCPHAGVAFGHQAALSDRLGRTSNFPTGFQVLVCKCQKGQSTSLGVASRTRTALQPQKGCRRAETRRIWSPRVAAAGHRGSRAGTSVARTRSQGAGERRGPPPSPTGRSSPGWVPAPFLAGSICIEGTARSGRCVGAGG